MTSLRNRVLDLLEHQALSVADLAVQAHVSLSSAEAVIRELKFSRLIYVAAKAEDTRGYRRVKLWKCGTHPNAILQPLPKPHLRLGPAITRDGIEIRTTWRFDATNRPAEGQKAME